MGSSPTSSRWVLETPATRIRLGYGRRLSGERYGGCGTIREEIVQQPPQPVFFNTMPGLTGTQTRKGDYQVFRRGAIGNCQAKVDTEARRLIGSIETPALFTGGLGGHAQLS